MITVALSGGLGNHLYQYAFGKVLSKKYDVRYVISHTFPNQYSYCLDKFLLKVPMITNPEGPNIDRSRSFAFDPKAFEIEKEPCILTGYWQNEKYFLNIEDELRAEMQLKDAPRDAVKSALEQIESAENSVSVHVRRGDYTGLSRRQEIALPTDYYDRAIKYVESRVKSPHFFVFSDEPWWVEEHLTLPSNKTMVHFDTHEDLWLMSKCKSAIIANSTFSWWGAWLNPDKERLVITPAEWLPSISIDDIAPDRWTRV